ncbi:GGDEF domain-containing protein [Roseomonas sp. CECT 9278]|uniref:GGDEF domain-containing protein n=1 Tax=Roseomonas sp. CECT 9278 TaxID=2845823 RepID=UPI001E2DE463|nr:GGDEF domain-containing protein [Roseomonas sp. CECT 9278]
MKLIVQALQVLIVLGGTGAAVVGVQAMAAWHHLPRRFLFTGFGVLACAAVAVLAADSLLGGTRAAGWRAALALLADGMLPLAFILLVQAYRRADLDRLKAQQASPVNQQTSLPNRALLIDQAIPALARCQRDQMPASVVAASVDGLAEIAQARGPRAAEAMMRDFAIVFRDATRAGDVAGHASAGVLAALLPSATPEAAAGMAERLRREASARLAHPGMDGRRLSVSVGIAPVGDGPVRAVLDEAIAAAEGALATAAAAGGDRVLEAPAPPLRSAGQPM